MVASSWATKVSAPQVLRDTCRARFSSKAWYRCCHDGNVKSSEETCRICKQALRCRSFFIRKFIFLQLVCIATEAGSFH
jgi:hypothetical protein